MRHDLNLHSMTPARFRWPEVERTSASARGGPGARQANRGSPIAAAMAAAGCRPRGAERRARLPSSLSYRGPHWETTCREVQVRRRGARRRSPRSSRGGSHQGTSRRSRALPGGGAARPAAGTQKPQPPVDARSHREHHGMLLAALQAGPPRFHRQNRHNLDRWGFCRFCRCFLGASIATGGDEGIEVLPHCRLASCGCRWYTRVGRPPALPAPDSVLRTQPCASSTPSAASAAVALPSPDHSRR